MQFFACRFLRADFCYTMRRLLRRFWRRSSADFLVHYAQMIAQILAQIFRRFSSMFWRFKNRCSRVTQKSAHNPQKNLRRPNGLSPEGFLLHLVCIEQTACHKIAARPKHSSRACEGPLGSLGPKGLVWFAPRFLKNKRSAKNPLCDPVPRGPCEAD